MYKAQIVIKNGNEIINQYYFSDDDKGNCYSARRVGFWAIFAENWTPSR